MSEPVECKDCKGTGKLSQVDEYLQRIMRLVWWIDPIATRELMDAGICPTCKGTGHETTQA